MRPAILALLGASGAGLSAAFSAPALGQGCEPAWASDYGRLDLQNTYVIKRLGPPGAEAIHAAGSFILRNPHRGPVAVRTPAGPAPWVSVGSPHQPWVATGWTVWDMEHFDDGSGPRLHLVTYGAGAILKWTEKGFVPTLAHNGSLWTSAVYDDGGGPTMFVGGVQSMFQGNPAALIRWDHLLQEWWPAARLTVGGGQASIAALTVFDDGAGPALFAGGRFEAIEGVAANSIARWRDGQWTALGEGVGGTAGSNLVLSILGDDGPAGRRLYAAGRFTTAGGQPASRVAVWDGGAWQALGQGIDGAQVRTLAMHEGRLHAGGQFGGHLVAWDGSMWDVVGGGTNGEVWALESAIEDTGGGPRPTLFVGGSFTEAGGRRALGMAQWADGDWMAGPDQASIGQVRMLKIVRYLGQERLFLSGDVAGLGGGTFWWDGESWILLSGVVASDLIAFDDGAGETLYIARNNCPGSPCNEVARWNGASWEPVGGAVEVRAMRLAVYDDGLGSGPMLYAAGAGNFGGIARWNGSIWQTVGGGVAGSAGDVRAIAVYDDGGGPALYVGGSFSAAGGVPAANIARWDGQQWSALGQGVGPVYTLPPGGYIHRVWHLSVHDDGTGPGLYVGGDFLTAGGAPSPAIARWDGQWTTYDPIPGVIGGYGVFAVSIFDDGTGPALYVGGSFESAGGLSSLARWRGTEWESVGGIGGTVNSLVPWDDGRGRALWVGGSFESAGGILARNLARYIACPEPVCYANCDQSAVPPVLNVDDFTCFIVEYAQASMLPHQQQIEHYANCDGSVVAPALNVDDFTCFINVFAQGCP